MAVSLCSSMTYSSYGGVSLFQYDVLIWSYGGVSLFQYDIIILWWCLSVPVWRTHLILWWCLSVPVWRNHPMVVSLCSSMTYSSYGGVSLFQYDVLIWSYGGVSLFQYDALIWSYGGVSLFQYDALILWWCLSVPVWHTHPMVVSLCSSMTYSSDPMVVSLCSSMTYSSYGGVSLFQYDVLILWWCLSVPVWCTHLILWWCLSVPVWRTHLILWWCLSVPVWHTHPMAVSLCSSMTYSSYGGVSLFQYDVLIWSYGGVSLFQYDVIILWWCLSVPVWRTHLILWWCLSVPVWRNHPMVVSLCSSMTYSSYGGVSLFQYDVLIWSYGGVSLFQYDVLILWWCLCSSMTFSSVSSRRYTGSLSCCVRVATTRRTSRKILLQWKTRRNSWLSEWNDSGERYHLTTYTLYLVPSSRVRLLLIPITIFLQASRSLVKPNSPVIVPFVTALMSSSHRARGLPLFLVPPPIPNIIDFSILFSLRMMCPKYDSCCFFINAFSGLVALISSITDLLVLPAIHGICSSLLQHYNSKLSVLLFSAFLIVQDLQPYSTTEKTNCILL